MEQNLKTYTGQAARVLKFLQGGCTQTQAALAVGVTEGYVGQLCAEIDFKIQIAQKLQADFEQAIETDKNYEYVEHELTKKLRNLVPFVIGVDDILRTLKIVNAAKKKISPITTPGETDLIGSTRTVKLIMPIAITQNFIVNPNSEVVSVDGQELVTLNTSSLDSLAKKAIEGESERIQNEPIPRLNFKLPEKVANDKPKDKWGNL